VGVAVRKWLLFSVFSLCLLLGVAMVIRADKPKNVVIRPPAVAGQFYPDNPGVLRKAVEAFLADAPSPRGDEVIAIVAPHAGYIYSGQVAADAWRQAAGGRYDLVVILGTNHTGAVGNAVAAYPGDAFETPLGVVWIDKDTEGELLRESPDCLHNSAAHGREHSIEVQVPFVQVLFPQAKILPLVVGRPDVELCRRFGEALAKVVKGKRALIVASSDLSHYPSYDDAVRADRQTLEAVCSLDPRTLSRRIREIESLSLRDLHTAACGEAPIMAAQAAARALGAKGARVVSYANSGDAAVGDRSRVVGYGAVVMTREAAPPPTGEERGPGGGGDLTPEDRRALLGHARKTIEQFLTLRTVPAARGFSEAARQKRGVFVTLKKHGQLRGCIGHMAPDTPLADLVGSMALQSAFNDPRFPPVKAEELKDIEIELSVLTPMKPVSGPEEIVVGRDGVLLTKGGRSAVFLPQVAVEQNWTKEEMLDHLAMKAGLPPKSWKEGCRFQTFQAEVFGEGEGGRR